MRPAGVEPSFSHYYEAMRAAAFAGQKAPALELLAEAEAATGEEVSEYIYIHIYVCICHRLNPKH